MDVEQDTVAVPTGAVDEQHRMFGGGAGEAVSEPLPKEADQLAIAAGDPPQEVQELWAVRRLCHATASQLRDAIGGIGRTTKSGPKVDGTARGAEQEAVPVELTCRRREDQVQLAELLHAGDEGRTACRLAVLVFRVCSQLGGDPATSIEGFELVISLPASVGPLIPFAVGLAVGQASAKADRDSFGDGILRDERILVLFGIVRIGGTLTADRRLAPAPVGDLPGFSLPA